MLSIAAAVIQNVRRRETGQFMQHRQKSVVGGLDEQLEEFLCQGLTPPSWPDYH